MGLVNIIKEIGHTEVFLCTESRTLCKGLALLWATDGIGADYGFYICGYISSLYRIMFGEYSLLLL